jgi:hypothetical protein
MEDLDRGWRPSDSTMLQRVVQRAVASGGDGTRRELHGAHAESVFPVQFLQRGDLCQGMSGAAAVHAGI